MDAGYAYKARAAVRTGFTLTEVLIAIAIVVVLVGLAAVNIIPQLGRSKEKAAGIELESLAGAVQMFQIEFGRIPTEEEGLEVLWSKDALEVEDETLEEKWMRFLEKPKPNDPWGNPWQYTDQSEHGQPYDIWSFGPDGEEGTEDDVISWAGLEEGGALDGGGGSLPGMPAN